MGIPPILWITIILPLILRISIYAKHSYSVRLGIGQCDREYNETECLGEILRALTGQACHVFEPLLVLNRFVLPRKSRKAGRKASGS